MRDTAAFTDPDNWTGGFYELSLELGAASPERLQSALSALWRAADISGCYGSLDHEPADQAPVPCTPASLTAFGHLRGTVVLPSGHRVVCGCFGGTYQENQDWLTFYVPSSAVGRTDHRVGGFPFGLESGPVSLSWRTDLDDWLAGIATAVFADIGFELGLIGFEVDAEITARGLAGVVPEERWEAYLMPLDGSLHYTRANR